MTIYVDEAGWVDQATYVDQSRDREFAHHIRTVTGIFHAFGCDEITPPQHHRSGAIMINLMTPARETYQLTVEETTGSVSWVWNVTRNRLGKITDLVPDAQLLDVVAAIQQGTTQAVERERRAAAAAARSWLAIREEQLTDSAAAPVAAVKMEAEERRDGGESEERGAVMTESADRHQLDGFQAVPLKEIDAAGLALTISAGVKEIPGLSGEAVERAMSDAAFVHRGQTRLNRGDFPRTPYIEHPLRNTLRLMRWGVKDEAVLVAAILHDTVEDNPRGFMQREGGWVGSQAAADAHDEQREALNVVRRRYGPAVARIVEHVTNPPRPAGQSDADRASAYAAHVAEAVAASPDVLLVKLADFGDNAAGLHHNASPENRAKVAKSALKYLPVCDILAGEVARQEAALRERVNPEALAAIGKMLKITKSRLEDLVESNPTGDIQAPGTTSERRAGVHVTEPSRGLTSTASAAAVDRSEIMAVLRDSHAWYRASAEGSWVPDYLNRRNLYAQMKPAGLGYAPPGYKTTLTHLRGLGHSDEAIEAAGQAVRSKKNGQLYDVFRDRLMFPITAATSREVVGFTGRVGEGTDPDLPKYWNTNETDMFHKGSLLYALGEDREELAAGFMPVFVEGPTDRLALREGRRDLKVTGVSSLGTAITAEQVGLVVDLVGRDREVAFGLDPDMAGRKAVLRAWEIATQTGLEKPVMISWPQGKDPAELIRAGRGNLMRDAINDRRPLLYGVTDIRLAEHRWTKSEEIVQRLTVAEHAMDQDLRHVPETGVAEYVGYLAEKLDLDPEVATSVAVEVITHGPRGKPGDHRRTDEAGDERRRNSDETRRLEPGLAR